MRYAVTEHDHMEQTNTSEQRDDALATPHCQAITQKGQPCRNRPLEGQRYCRTHAPPADAAGATPNEAHAAANGSASEEIAIITPPRETSGAATAIDRAPTDAALRNATAESVQELEIEI